jgi:hypothetical protein
MPRQLGSAAVSRVRDGTAEDLQGIAALQADVEENLRFGEAEYCSLWRWLCESNPTGAAKVLVGQVGDGPIASHEAMVRFPAVIAGREYCGGLACLLVVGASYRRGLLFMKTEMTLLSQYSHSGMDFAFSVVRDYMVKPHRALGFHDVGKMPVYARPYRVAKLVGRVLGRGKWVSALTPLLRAVDWLLRIQMPCRHRGLHIADIDRLCDVVAGQIEGICTRLGSHTLRTAELLNWRYRGCEGREYKLVGAFQDGVCVGFAAMRRMPMHEFDTLAIVDLVFSPDDPRAGQSLLRAVHETAVRMKVDLVATALNSDSLLMPTLRWSGFLQTPERYTVIAHCPKEGDVSIESLRTSSWHRTWYEHDYV